jgi:3-oxoacyl-[acyl-carrier protein] reductase
MRRLAAEGAGGGDGGELAAGGPEAQGAGDRPAGSCQSGKNRARGGKLLHATGNPCRVGGMEAQTSTAAVLVTGASRGLGRGIALELARAGMSVGVHYAGNRAAAEETAAACAALAPGAVFPLLQADLGDAGQRHGLVAAATAALGRLDALVSNAGIAPPERKDIAEAGEASFDKVLEVNLKAPYFLAQDAARGWLAAPGGSALPGGYKLVFVSSISATAASLNRGEYCISKAGLAMAARLWALRLAEVGQVIELRPGIMETDMTAGVKDKYDAIIGGGQVVPMKRWGRPEDVGRAVRSFLCGDWPFTTGDAVYLDGGFHLEKL